MAAALSRAVPALGPNWVIANIPPGHHRIYMLVLSTQKHYLVNYTIVELEREAINKSFCCSLQSFTEFVE